MPSRTPPSAAASEAGRAMALRRWSRMDPEERAEVARRLRAGYLRRFEREVDPNNTLDPAERQRRAEQARLAHLAEMRRRKLAKAEARKAATAQEMTEAEAAALERKIRRLIEQAPPEARERVAAALAHTGHGGGVESS